MEPNIAGVALADRGDQCSMPRIPTGRYPYFSTTIVLALDAAGNGAVDFEAERDMLFDLMSITTGVAADLATIRVDMEYCNIKYLVNSAGSTWTTCCQRKPIFLVAVRENKKLSFAVRGGTAAATVAITLSGFQGSGCCG